MERVKEEERRRTRGKRGIKTKATVRNNGYDHKFHTRQAILTYPDVPPSHLFLWPGVVGWWPDWVTRG
jgi:hypothetical protein